MKKWIVGLLVLMVMGCQKSPDQTVSEHLLCFVDDFQREVCFEKPERVATLLGSYADLYLLAGGEIVAAPDDAWEDYHLDLSEDVINLGMTKELSFERLLQSDPDLILASSNTSGNVEWMDQFEALNLPVLYYEVSNFEDYLTFLDVCTQITGQSDRYERYGTEMKQSIDKTLERAQDRLQLQDKEVKVLSLRASSTFIRAKNSKNNILGEMLHDLGCVNIADHDESLLENLSLEHILMEDPDFIFFVQQGDNASGTKEYIERFISENPAWSQLRAVKNDQVYMLEKSLYALKPNSRWDEAYMRLEEIISGQKKK